MKDTNLLRSITSLLVACLTLAGGTIMLGMFLNRIFGPIQSVAPTRVKVSTSVPVWRLDLEYKDQNLRELRDALDRQELDSLKFPEGVEEAMLGDGIPLDRQNI